MKTTSVDITDLNHDGDGVGRIDGQVVFVKGALPGETVEITLAESKKRFGVGELTHITTPSPHRVTPPCPYVTACGGCPLMHLDYAEQLQVKARRVHETLKRIGGVEITPRATLPSPLQLGYRNKVTFTVDNGLMGLIGAEGLVDIDRCALIDHRGHTCYSSCRSKELPSGKLMIRVGDDHVQAVHNHQIIDGPDPLQITLCGLTFHLRAPSFFQVNTQGAELLYKTVVDLSGITAEDCVIDAYCGVGTLSIIMSQVAAQVVGIEVVPEAVEDATLNAQRNDRDNVTFICGKVEEYSGSGCDLMVVNPPRGGIDEKVCQWLTTRGPGRLVYISCDVATLARDLKRLARYVPKVIQPIDLFPQTPHVETVVRLDRQP